MSSSLNQGILVTIVCSSGLQEHIQHLLKTLGASGYTITQAQGAGSHGMRMGDIAGYNTNVEVKTVVTPELSDKLFEQLQQLQATHALVAFQQKVEGLFD